MSMKGQNAQEFIADNPQWPLPIFIEYCKYQVVHEPELLGKAFFSVVLEILTQ